MSNDFAAADLATWRPQSRYAPAARKSLVRVRPLEADSLRQLFRPKVRPLTLIWALVCCCCCMLCCFRASSVLAAFVFVLDERLIETNIERVSSPARLKEQSKAMPSSLS